MKVRTLVAMILLAGDINLNIREISAKIKEIGTEDDPKFRIVPGGIWSDEAEEFLKQPHLFHFVSGKGYALTAMGRRLCEEMVAAERAPILQQTQDTVEHAQA